ncbi:MAG: elongation factor G [Candidatus Bipolaricaulota bacterium]|nr:elongation factor G [Candidatus Bipolaricaulota bacterium]
MAEDSIRKVRNIGVIAHIDAGKTTLTERILFYTGKIHRMGEVHEGTTEMDWMDQERERGITITAAATTVSWRDHTINIIDTPGHVDFTAEVERSLRVLDGAVVLFSGIEGVESQSEAVWRQADRYRVPRVAFVNKLDRVGADFARAVADIEEKLGSTVLPLTVPWHDGDGRLLGMVDLLGARALRWDPGDQGRTIHAVPVPEELLPEVDLWRERLLEALAEVSDPVAEKYLAGETPSGPELLAAIRRATIERLWVPVLGGSALGNIGVQPVLDAVVDFLPSPDEAPPVHGFTLDGGEVFRRPSPDDPFLALVFKVATDPYAERLLYTRIYAGRVTEGEVVLNATTGRKVRLVRLFRLHANQRERIEGAGAGDIVGVLASGPVLTGETLTHPDHPLVLERIAFPEPVVFLAVEPRSERDEAPLREALARIAQEDPTFQVRDDEATGQLLVGGMGELQLEVQLRRVREEFGVPHRVGQPIVAYRETLRRPVEVEEEWDQPVGGRGQYARVALRFEPLPRGAGFEFLATVPPEVLPPEYVAATRRGIEGGLGASPVGGFPLTDLRAVLHGGHYDPVDSSEVAFEACGTHALRRALLEGGALLLEPVAEGDIITPTEYLGEVVSDLGRRRGQIQSVHNRGVVEVIRCAIPLGETFGYTTQLRSLTQGRAVHTLRVTRYDVVPEDIARAVWRSRGYDG